MFLFLCSVSEGQNQVKNVKNVPAKLEWKKQKKTQQPLFQSQRKSLGCAVLQAPTFTHWEKNDDLKITS